jgi:hypothetical protein
MRCLRCAGAPRRPAGGSELSPSILSRHADLYDPGEFDHRKSRASMTTWPSPRSERLGTPNPPAIRFARGSYFGASRFTHLLRPASLLAPLYGSNRYARPPGAFTSRLSTARSPSPLLDMTTTATGLLCWRDFHPQEWQLASLHQIRTSGFPTYGSYLEYLTASVCRTRRSAWDTRSRLRVRCVLCSSVFLLVPALGSTGSAAVAPALFVGFPATMAESDFSRSCIIGYGSSPSRCGPVQHPL